MHPRPLHSDTGSHWIDAFVTAADRDFCPLARVAGYAVNLDDALGYLRHFRRKELAEEFGPSAGEQNLRPSARLEHLVYVAPHSIALAIALAADLLFVWNGRFGPTEVEDDVAVADLLHGTGLDEANSAYKFVVYPLALGFADPLNENLLGGLDGIAAKVGEIELLHQHRAQLDMRVYVAGVGEENLHGRLDHFFDDGLAGVHGHFALGRVDVNFVIFRIAVVPFGG